MLPVEVLVILKNSIRTAWSPDKNKRYYSVVDVIGELTDCPDPKNYWKTLKSRLKKEGCDTECIQLKLLASDGKMRLGDVADMPHILRIIQSVKSPMAESVKMWMAGVAYEQIEKKLSDSACEDDGPVPGSANVTPTP